MCVGVGVGDCVWASGCGVAGACAGVCVCAAQFVRSPVLAAVLQTGWGRYFCQFRKAEEDSACIGHIKFLPIVGRGQLPVSLHGYSIHGYSFHGYRADL